ncbi:hypothetical protein [Vitreimonas sp.]|uniref:hypothetical protein n=1 Tax=Vitreimonas sp. TaxID=3069702 RepID=UPI002ED9B008
MLVWTRWGLAIPFIGYMGALFGNYSALAVGQQIDSAAPWLMAAGWVLGGVTSALLLLMFDEWRETRGGAPSTRVLIDEATGERFDAPSAGDTFFWLHTRRWMWLSLMIGLVGAAVTIYQQIPLQEM